MNGNPFYVAPGNDYSGGLQGLGMIAGQIREEREKKSRAEEIKAAVTQAYKSGDPEQMAQVAIQYPEAQQTLQSLYGFRNERTKQNALETYKSVLANKQNPQAALDAINERIAFVESQGGDPSTVSIKARNNLQKMIQSGQDPSPFFRAAELEYAGIASPQEWKAYSATSGMDSGKIGQYNPGDYTPESWAKFVSTRDPSSLQRYESQQVVDIGGVRTLVDRTTGTRTPLTTAAEVSGNQATIKTAVTQAEQNVKGATEPKIQAEVAKARQLAVDEAKKLTKQQGQLSKIDDANRIYKSLGDSDLDLIYGSGEKWYPEVLRSQKGIDLMAQRDQLVGMLNLAARGELQGQGSITEGEGAAVLAAATTLGNPNVSPAEARQALDSAMERIYGGAGKEFTAPQKSTETAAQRLARLRGGN
jgi:hypothetical protein